MSHLGFDPMSCKALYRVRNWRIYNQSLIDRGNITVWFAPEAIKGWQNHQRSLAETAMLRFKKILGGHLASKYIADQTIEARIKAQILNRMTHFGMPDSYKMS